jgi:Ca-activated chloride channel family protein
MLRWFFFAATASMFMTGGAPPASAAPDPQEKAPTVENVPGIRIVNPAADIYLYGRVPITVEPAPDIRAAIAEMRFYVDGKEAGVLTQEPWELIYDFGDEGRARAIRVVARDAAGQSWEAGILTAPPPESDFLLGATSVSLDVTVTDGRGKLVAGLTRDDFEVYEDGRRVEISHFSAEEKPLLVCLVLDTSGSMHGEKIERAVEASQRFVSRLKPADRAAVVVCGPAVRTYNDFTGDFKLLITRIGRLRARIGAGTPLKAAIYETIDSFEELAGRKAMIVISDGEDISTTLSPSDLDERARRADVKIYAIGLYETGEDREKWLDSSLSAKLLRDIATLSGGRALFPESAAELPVIFDSVFDELRSQYSIGYSPPASRGDRWRSVEVKLTRAGLEARTRKGYYPREMMVRADNRSQ